MTRDEAEPFLLAIVRAMDWKASKEERAKLIGSALSALGMLKLDEPPSAEQRAGAVLSAYVDGSDTAAILMELSDAGLKIVEK